jgi:hypothetical protein
VVPNFEQVQREAEREMAASLAWPAPRDPATAIDAFEHDLARLRPLLSSRSGEAVKGHAHYLLRLNEALRRSVVMRWARWRKEWSNDGLIRVTDARRRGGPSSHHPAVFAVRACTTRPARTGSSSPRSIGSMSGEGQAIQRMDPPTRGSLFHGAQADFFRPSRARIGCRSRAESADALIALDETIVRYQPYTIGSPGDRAIWTDEIAAIRIDLRAWPSIWRRNPGDGALALQYALDCLAIRSRRAAVTTSDRRRKARCADRSISPNVVARTMWRVTVTRPPHARSAASYWRWQALQPCSTVWSSIWRQVPVEEGRLSLHGRGGFEDPHRDR